MTRNQKIALGCGGAGCLGLIVVAIAGGLIYYFARQAAYRASRDYNFNVNVNRNSNSDSSNSNSGSSVAPVSDMSDDDKHKLFHAGSMTGDPETIKRVNLKLGLIKEDEAFTQEYQQFVKDHVIWVFRNTDFLQEINTAEKARAYIDEHLE